MAGFNSKALHAVHSHFSSCILPWPHQGTYYQRLSRDSLTSSGPVSPERGSDGLAASFPPESAIINSRKTTAATSPSLLLKLLYYSCITVPMTFLHSCASVPMAWLLACIASCAVTVGMPRHTIRACMYVLSAITSYPTWGSPLIHGFQIYRSMPARLQYELMQAISPALPPCAPSPPPACTAL